MHWDGQHWHTLAIPDDVFADTGNVVPDGQGGYWFGDAAILTGSTWTSEPTHRGHRRFRLRGPHPGHRVLPAARGRGEPQLHHPAANALPIRPVDSDVQAGERRPAWTS